MLKAIKIRLYPNAEQQAEMNKLLGCARFVYNYALGAKINAYKKDKTSLGMPDLSKKIIELKNTPGYTWLKEAHSKVMQQSLMNMDVAYKNFFKNGSDFPKFKKKDDTNKCRFPVDAIIGVEGNRINLIKKINGVLYKCSVRDEKYLNKYHSHLKSATLTREKCGIYSLSVLVDGRAKRKKLPFSDKKAGIDIGIKDFVVTDLGLRYPNLKSIRKNKRKLARLQRSLARKGFHSNLNGNNKPTYERSKNRERSRLSLSKFHNKLDNQKKYYIHDVTNRLLNENQVIATEDLNVSGMMKNHKLARSIQELSIIEFLRILNYKALWYGREIVAIDRFFPSSKMCSCCGHKHNGLKLSDRKWTCPDCAVVHDRDINAANNILNEGVRIVNETKIGLSKPEFTLGEIGSVSLIESNRKIGRRLNKNSIRSMNQEAKAAKPSNVVVPESKDSLNCIIY